MEVRKILKSAQALENKRQNMGEVPTPGVFVKECGTY